MEFSTFDRDNDLWSGTNCVTIWSSGGGNWNNHCYEQNLNGLYHDNSGQPEYSVMFWHDFDNNDYLPLKASKIMFRRSSP